MRRRLISILLAMGLISSLGACGGADSEKADNESTEKTTTESTGGTDGSQENASVITDYYDFRLDMDAVPQEKKDTTVYLACSVRGLENPYIVAITNGMEMFADFLRENGQKVETTILDSGGDNDTEINNMRQFSAMSNGNGLVYSDPNESSITGALIEAMGESGGYIGTAWSWPEGCTPADGDYGDTWVVATTPDNISNGYNTAKALFEAMGGEGKIFVLQGKLGNTAAEDRYTGLKQALEEYPGVEIIAEDTGNWSATEALTLVETWLNLDSEVDGIWCANDDMAVGAVQALDQVGLKGKVKVSGIDAINDMLTLIEEGAATATASSNGYLQGGYTLAFCYAAWCGQLDLASLPAEARDFYTEAVLITNDNIAEYKEKYVDSMPEFDFQDLYYFKLKGTEHVQ